MVLLLKSYATPAVRWKAILPTQMLVRAHLGRDVYRFCVDPSWRPDCKLCVDDDDDDDNIAMECETMFCMRVQHARRSLRPCVAVVLVMVVNHTRCHKCDWRAQVARGYFNGGRGPKTW